MHVETPPLKQLTASGKPRSLFMDIKHPLPIEDESSNSSGSVGATPRVTPRVFSYRKGQQPEKKEWWDAPKATVRRDPVRDVSFFEFNMPEHLPNSPMCPANPKHKGKLRVCVVSLLWPDFNVVDSCDWADSLVCSSIMEDPSRHQKMKALQLLKRRMN